MGGPSELEAILGSAIRALAARLGPLDAAPLYRTVPVSPHPQPDFLNTAVVGRTALAPDALLTLAKALELAAGRRPGARLTARPLDIDLLLFADRFSTAPELTLPHPELIHRRFALVPLARLAPAWRIPPDGPTVSAALAALSPGPEVRELGWSAPVLP